MEKKIVTGSRQLFFERTVTSQEETAEVARQFGKELHPGEVAAFYGELGSGKTFFIKWLCEQLQVMQPVTSPTFTIMNEYYTKGNFLIYHFDFYRIEADAELSNLGLDEFLYNEHICLIEWANKIEKFLPASRWEVHLDFTKNNPRERLIKIFKGKNA